MVTPPMLKAAKPVGAATAQVKCCDNQMLLTKALIASRQRSQSVVYSLKRCFMTRGGRDLDKAPRKTSRTYLRLRKKGKEVHRRPKQMGNTMLYFVTCQMKRGGTKEEHIATWKGMTEEARAWWKTRHHNHVRLKRSQHDQEAKARRSASACAPIDNCSSWGLGCEEWPLKPEAVKAWLLQFHGKQRGLETLKKVDSPECKSYVEAVEAGACTYHMKDAMVLFCNTFLGDEVSHDVVKECGLTQSIVASELPSPGCHSLHPGRCKTRDKELCSALDALWACMPKMSCVVRLQCGKFQVYCRSVLGMEENFSNYITSCDPHRGILSDIYSDIPSGIPSVTFYLAFHLAYILTFYLVFYLANILTFLSGIYSGIQTGIYSDNLSGILSHISSDILSAYLAFNLTCVLTFYLAYILSVYLTCILAFYLATILLFGG